MMYAYSVSTKRSVVVAVIALAVVISEQRAHAQPGWVLSHKKISDTQGGFTGILDEDDHFGRSLVMLGDLNGDGVGDVAVGADGDDDGGWQRGAVWVLFLNPDGTVNDHQKISDTQGGFTGTLGNGYYFGRSVASLGDLDGDGVGDLAVGGGWAVWVLFLNTDGTVKSHQKISNTQGGFLGTLHDDDNFGMGVASLGDLDGDGVGDMAVGASRDDDGGPNRGAVWILFALRSTPPATRVFVTSTTTDADLGGIAGADATCNGLASTAGLGGSWVAWLSTTTLDAVDRLTPGSGPFVRAVDGTKIANDIADLTDSSLDVAIEDDENGTDVGFRPVWTATAADGLYTGTGDCNGWTSNSSTFRAMTGNASRSTSSWTTIRTDDCDLSSARLYCFEITEATATPTATPTPTPEPGAILQLLAGASMLLALAKLRGVGLGR
ncbi:MAG: FG-GAP repeat protein, partial [Planctomycetes bacterium]|nr:FG-GAP repeat protein [Planctomycetota bacterium]